ncbi:MBL fold metallo-hydrolase [Thermomonas brevis]|uniref:MBL fold metallo-hydrolase n=1 Tax=Thermomonas brevis TaxID=215691 RepID=A0A7G9QRM7_9GAMM|nr:MBL fold metallo-hydrolase [Thermomonas brevis]
MGGWPGSHPSPRGLRDRTVVPTSERTQPDFDPVHPRCRRWLPRLLLPGTIALTASHCLRAPIGDYAASHHSVNGRFRNATPRPADAPEPGLKTFWDFFFNKPKDTEPHAPIPVRRLTRAELDAAPDRSLYRLGHSTILMKLRGRWWITDPVFAERASPVQWFGPKRFHAPPIALDDLPPIRGVLLSHDHYDHLDKAAVRALAKKADLFLAPLGVGDRLASWGVPEAKIRQFDWWQETGIDGLTLAFTPTQHFSGRGIRDGDRTLWGSWVIVDGDRRVYFSGDSGYFDGFAEIGRRYGPFDLAMMETGAYNEQWPYVHMQPAQTVRAFRDVRGMWLLPIHNGTFDLAMHPWHEPFDEVLRIAEAQGIRVATPVMGERIDLDAPQPGERWWRGVMAQEAAR